MFQRTKEPPTHTMMKGNPAVTVTLLKLIHCQLVSATKVQLSCITLKLGVSYMHELEYFLQI